MNQDLKSNFSQAATMLTKLFNSANQQHKEAYAKGQKDMIDEIVQFCLNENNNLKTIELSKLDVFLQNKIQQIQEKDNRQQGVINQIGQQAANQVHAIESQSNNTIPMHQQNDQNVQTQQHHQQQISSNNQNYINQSAQSNLLYQNDQANHSSQQNMHTYHQPIQNNHNGHSLYNQPQQAANINSAENTNFLNRKIFQIKGYKAQQNNVMNEENNQ